MRVTTKGQVTIPKHVREQAGIRAGTEIEFAVEGDVVTLKRVPASAGRRSRGQGIVDALRGTRTANRDLSTDEIMKLLRGDD